MDEPNIYRHPDPELDITENIETQEIFIKSPKRQETIIVYKPMDQTSFFRVRYESGKPVPKCEGQFTSLRNAMNAVKVYLHNSKKTENRKQFDIFGPEKPEEERPVLRKKKVKNGAKSKPADG